jgi:hypothetical protein
MTSVGTRPTRRKKFEDEAPARARRQERWSMVGTIAAVLTAALFLVSILVNLVLR